MSDNADQLSPEEEEQRARAKTSVYISVAAFIFLLILVAGLTVYFFGPALYVFVTGCIPGLGCS